MSSFTRKLTELGIEPMSKEKIRAVLEGEYCAATKQGRRIASETYTQFLATYGLLLCSQEKSTVRPQGDALYFGWFYSFDELVDAVNTYREILPETIMPIGDADGGGNQFCLGVSGKDFGKVYFHNHGIGWQADAETYQERGEDVPSNIRYQTVNLVASSFEQFILNMVKES